MKNCDGHPGFSFYSIFLCSLYHACFSVTAMYGLLLQDVSLDVFRLYGVLQSGFELLLHTFSCNHHALIGSIPSGDPFAFYWVLSVLFSS